MIKTNLDPRRNQMATLLLPAAAAIFVYWPILFLPNIYDTLLHTQLAEDLTLASVWLPNDDFGFYRPLVFLPLVLIQDWLGYPAPLLQFLNLAQHAINAVLLTILVDRLSGRRPLAVLAGLLLAVFPFGYQALAIYGNNAYLTATGFVLWGLTLGLTGHPTARRMWLLAVVQLTGFLVHETAVLLLPLIVGWLILAGEDERPETRDEGKTGDGALPFLNDQIERNGRAKPRSLKALSSLVSRLWSLILVWFAYLTFYFFLPRGGGPALDYGGNALWPKVLLFLQTLSHPFAWVAHLLPNIPAQTIILASFTLTALLAGWGWMRLPRQRPLLLWGLGWWVMASLLVGVTLPTYYIADGARLLYPGAPGLALVWGVLLLPRPNLAPGRYRLEQVVLVAGVIFVLATGTQFIRQMIGYYTMVSEPVKGIQSYDSGEIPKEIVLVNPPQWVSPPRNTYAIGTEFAPLLGDHLFAAELLRANGIDRHVTILSAPGLMVETPYNVGLFDIRAEETITTAPALVFITRYTAAGVETSASGQLILPAERADSAEPLGRVGPYLLYRQGALLDCDDTLTVSLELEPIAAVPSTLSFFIQAIGESGFIAQADGPPLGVPPARIAENWGVVDFREIITKEGIPTHVLIGAYDFTTGERFPAVTATGEPLPDNAWVVEVEVGCEGE